MFLKSLRIAGGIAVLAFAAPAAAQDKGARLEMWTPDELSHAFMCGHMLTMVDTTPGAANRESMRNMRWWPKCEEFRRYAAAHGYRMAR